MRILHLDNGREMRGGQWQVLSLMLGLRDLGVEQRLLARHDSPLARAAAQHELDVSTLDLERLLACRGWATLVHAHDGASHTRAAALHMRPLVVSRRVAFPLRSGWLSRWKYRQPNLFLAVSHHVASILEEAGISPSRVRVVYDGVELPSHLAIGDEVVALRSNDPGKCNALMREAALIGNFPVTFSSFLPEDLKHSRVFVYLSQSEGLGSAALLAMAHGVPVVASRIPGLAEVVDAESGLLVENTAAEVARAVRALLDQPEAAHAMGLHGRQRVESRFLYRHMVEGTLAAYKELH